MTESVKRKPILFPLCTMLLCVIRAVLIANLNMKQGHMPRPDIQAQRRPTQECISEEASIPRNSEKKRKVNQAVRHCRTVLP